MVYSECCIIGFIFPGLQIPVTQFQDTEDLNECLGTKVGLKKVFV